jgi:hypothetical protein
MKRMMADGDQGQAFRQLSTDAQLLYIIGVLICDNVGFIAREKLDEATNDPDFRFAATVIAGRIGLLGPRATMDRYA